MNIPVNFSKLIHLVSGMSNEQNMPRNLKNVSDFDRRHRHEQSKNLHNMVQPRVCDTIVVFKRSNKYLRNYSANLTTRRTYTEGRRTIPGGVDFTWNKESCRVGPEVLKEIAEAIERK